MQTVLSQLVAFTAACGIGHGIGLSPSGRFAAMAFWVVSAQSRAIIN
jgi:hypothetical protein